MSDDHTFAMKSRAIEVRVGKSLPSSHDRHDMSDPFPILFFSVERRIMTIERNFQKGVIKEIKRRLPGCYVLKNDPNYIQGIPDLTVLYKDRWGMLEVKKSASAKHQPNQDHYVAKMNDDSFAAFIYPENKDYILDALQQHMTRTDISTEVTA